MEVSREQLMITTSETPHITQRGMRMNRSAYAAAVNS